MMAGSLQTSITTVPFQHSKLSFQEPSWHEVKAKHISDTREGEEMHLSTISESIYVVEVDHHYTGKTLDEENAGKKV
jgi:hypothetical protein